MAFLRVPSSTTLSVIGLVLSVYAVYVEHRVAHKEEEEEDFVSLCDIEQIGASCSSVFSLPEGKLLSYFGLVPSGHVLDVPNAMIGAVYYTYMLFLTGLFPIILTQVAASMALSTSLFLAYQLTVLKKLCILCWSTHVINVLLWWKTVRLAAYDIQQQKQKKE